MKGYCFSKMDYIYVVLSRFERLCCIVKYSVE